MKQHSSSKKHEFTAYPVNGILLSPSAQTFSKIMKKFAFSDSLLLHFINHNKKKANSLYMY